MFVIIWFYSKISFNLGASDAMQMAHYKWTIKSIIKTIKSIIKTIKSIIKNIKSIIKTIKSIIN